jgi:hypothetical protein
VTEDFEILAQKLVGTEYQATEKGPAAKPAFRIFNRSKEPARV